MYILTSARFKEWVAGMAEKAAEEQPAKMSAKLLCSYVLSAFNIIFFLQESRTSILFLFFAEIILAMSVFITSLLAW